MIGSVLKGTYRIYDSVGSGGFATVYLGRNVRTNEVVAIKVLRQEYSTDSGLVQRFEREARLVHDLNHPNIVRMLDYGVEGNARYLVMEYVEGKTVAQLIQERGPLPVDQAVDIARQVCQALDAAWQKSIVHRDIKPHNVMVDPKGAVKVMDFGIARAHTEAALTQAGVFMGTLRYMAPEVAKGEKVDIRSDLYALGIVLYEMLTGAVPFVADSPAAILHHHIATPPPPLRSRRRDVPDWLERVVAQALAKSPEQRFAAPRDMLAALNPPAAALGRPDPTPPRVKGGSPGSQPMPPSPVQAGSHTKVRLVLLVAGLVALAALAIVLVSALFGRPPSMAVVLICEPNDRPEEACGPLDSGQTYYAHFLTDGDVEDFYLVSLARPGDIEIRLGQVPPGCNYDLYLHDAAHTVIAYGTRTGDADEYILATGQPAQTYYVSVRRREGPPNETSPYSLRVDLP